MGGFSVGIGAGLDVQTLVRQIIFAESAPIRALERRQSETDQKIKAFNDLTAKLNELKTKISALNSADKFAARTATSSNKDILTATATSQASPGTYEIVVSRLARLDNYKSDSSFSSSDAAIGTGSFDLTVGSTTKTITINSTNNTLTGLKNAINSSGADVNANIVQDGTNSYRITITSKKSGSANAITISNNTLTKADASAFTFSRTYSIVSTSELDASLTVNGLSVTSGSNSVTSVIQGATLNLVGTSASTVTLTVGNDTASVKTAIQDFVKAYNDAYSYINSQFAYDNKKKTAGVLAGDGLLRRVQSDLAAVVRTRISGLAAPINNFGIVGIDLTNDGTLKINDTDLDAKLASDFESIKKLFLAWGAPTNSNVVFLGVGPKTSAGTYEINITQLPEAATLTSPNAIVALLGVNETLTFTSGGTTSTVNLTATMTIDDIVTAVNNQFTTDGMKLTASKDGSNKLVITSKDKGSTISFTVTSDTAAGGTGFGTAGMSDSGRDVGGTFKDTATGTVYSTTATSFDVLKGSSGPSQDLRIQYIGTTTGIQGTVAVTIGYAEQLKRKLDSQTDVTSPIADIVDRLNQQVTTIKDDILEIQRRLKLREQTLIDQFSRADQALRQLAELQATISNQLR